MWSKNYLILWKISENISHFLRNIFWSKRIRITKRIFEKIKFKHREVFFYVENKENFEVLMNSVLFSYEYLDEFWNINYNFIAFNKDRNEFVLFSFKNEQYFISLKTVFLFTKNRFNFYLKKWKSGNIKFFKSEEKILEF